MLYSNIFGHTARLLCGVLIFLPVFLMITPTQAQADFYVECNVYATTDDMDKNGFVDFVIHSAKTSGGHVPNDEPCLQDRIGVTERVKLQGINLKKHRQQRFILSYEYSYRKNENGQSVDVEKWFYKGTPIQIIPEDSKSVQTPKEQPTRPQMQICTQEAKICPDGSTVSRTGPNCEFAPCP